MHNPIDVGLRMGLLEISLIFAKAMVLNFFTIWQIHENFKIEKAGKSSSITKEACFYLIFTSVGHQQNKLER